MTDTKRRDNKGKVLHSGESQDATGRYCYRYQDPFGKRKAVYSWRLTVADSMPALPKYEILRREMKFFKPSKIKARGNMKKKDQKWKMSKKVLNRGTATSSISPWQ